MKPSILILIIVIPIFFNNYSNNENKKIDIDISEKALKANNLKKIERYLEDAKINEHFSGVAIVVQKGEVLLNYGYGMSTAFIENTSDTTMHVASITKQFTAAAIMLLMEKGKIDLNACINYYLPEKYRCHNWKNVTIHHLLSHRSGIADYAVERNYYDVRKGFCYGDTIKGMINEARNAPLEFEPGSQFKYSNIGYTILGIIIEEQTGCSYRKFIKDNLLIPAKMFFSDIHDETYIEKDTDALGYRWNETQRKFVLDNEIDLPVTAADGGLVTTTEDLLKWNNVISGKTPGILRQESIAKMTTPINFCSDKGYGYGLFIDNSSQIKIICHPGVIVGFRSFFCYLPEKETYIAVLCNNTATNPVKMTGELLNMIHPGIIHPNQFVDLLNDSE